MEISLLSWNILKGINKKPKVNGCGMNLKYPCESITQNTGLEELRHGFKSLLYYLRQGI